MNKDGKISNKELVQAARLLGITITAKEGKELIQTVDLNSRWRFVFVAFLKLYSAGFFFVCYAPIQNISFSKGRHS